LDNLQRRIGNFPVEVSKVVVQSLTGFSISFSGEILREVYARDKGLDGNLPEG
jgi:hypothetical protein